MESGLDNCRFNRGYELQSPLLHVRALEALANPDCGWFYRADCSGFDAIPGSPIAYWATPSTIAAFSQNHSLSSIAKPRQGLATSDNNRFLKYWWEISNVKFGVGFPVETRLLQVRKSGFHAIKAEVFENGMATMSML